MINKAINYLVVRWDRLTILIQFLLKKENEKKKKIVVFDIKDQNTFSRHLVNPTLFFLKNNYSVIFRLRRSLINQFGYYYKLINKKNNVSLRIRRPEKFTIYLTNVPVCKDDIYLKPDLFGLENYVEKHHRIPPPMHPLVYEEGTYKRLIHLKKKLNKTSKAYKIVFAGSLIKGNYKSFFWGDDYYVNRVELIEIIKKEFPKNIFIPKSLREYKDGSDKDICIIDRKYFSLDLEDYFTLYLSSHFSFCPPGIRQPFCHNLVESMFVGCIPILKYGYLLPTPLNEGINSIKYSSPDNLLTKIKMVLEMSGNEIENLERNVIKYYDTCLAPDAVIADFEKSVENGVSTLYIPAGT